MKIHFLGAADTVTGSRHLVEIGGQRCCSTAACSRASRHCASATGRRSPSAREIDAVVLSHAHLDHSGWLPVLVKQGFKGPIHCTAATRDLAEVMLLDSAHLQEEDARRANRGGFSRHAPALPLYTVAEARRAIAKLSPLPPGRTCASGEVQVDSHAGRPPARRQRASRCAAARVTGVSPATWAAATTC